MEVVCNEIDEIVRDLKKRLRKQNVDQQLVSGTKIFIARYMYMYQTLSKRSNAALASAFVPIWLGVWRQSVVTKVQEGA